MQIFGVFCWSCEATIEVSDEGIQPGVGGFNTADSLETHLFDKPILKCLICSLHTAFSLWTVGTNQLDPKFRKYTAKLGDSGRSGSSIIDPENAVLIAVERKGLAVLLEILASGHHVIKS